MMVGYIMNELHLTNKEADREKANQTSGGSLMTHYRSLHM